MGWLMRWERQDPAKVLERKQEMEAANKQFVRWADIRVDPFGAVWFGGMLAMTRDESEQIEALVMDWYFWTRNYRPKLGAPSRTSFAHGAASDYVHESDDDRDARLAVDRAEQVDVCIDALRWQLRSALGLHAANKAAGAEVFSNPRLSREEQHAAYQEAKSELLRPLVLRGLVKQTEERSKTACVHRIVRR